LDFLVVGLGPEAVASALERYGHVEEIESRAFGVFKFTPTGASDVYDVALPRRDRWTGLAYKDMAAEIGVSLEEDLARRDFTVNAMALSAEGELVDPYAGQGDLRARLIRAVGDPWQRFSEDPSRILRGLRLACELDFAMEPATFRAMTELGPEVVRRTERGETRVAPEVAGAEFLRGFAAQPGRLVRLWDETGLLALLLPEVAAMKETPQPAAFHTEGGVLTHALLALERLRDLEEPGAQAAWGSPIAFRPRDLHTQLAVLLHDVGKPPTLQYPATEGDRIRFPEHEPVGARLAGEIADRLRLSVFPRDDPLHVDRDRLAFLVGHHMICLSLNERTKLATLERYFFASEEIGGELLSLIYADMAATVPPSGEPDFSCYERMIEKLRQVAGVVRAHREECALPHLLSGEEIMAWLGLPAGPPVGQVKEALREQQLQGKLTTAQEAREWLGRHGREVLSEEGPR
jgi:poly(A) polymerase